jgi:hypothetical protein
MAFPDSGDPLPEQASFIDPQHLLNIADWDGLVRVLQESLQEFTPPLITLQNPHAWSGYVSSHAEHLRQWLHVSDDA